MFESRKLGTDNNLQYSWNTSYMQKEWFGIS